MTIHNDNSIASDRLDLAHTAGLYLMDLLTIYCSEGDELNELRKFLIYLNNLITFNEQQNSHGTSSFHQY